MHSRNAAITDLEEWGGLTGAATSGPPPFGEHLRLEPPIARDAPLTAAPRPHLLHARNLRRSILKLAANCARSFPIA